MKASSLRFLEELVIRYPALQGCRGALSAALEALADSFAAGGQLLVCGNGGSAADALHITGELMKGFILQRRMNERTAAALKASCPDGAYLAEHLQGALPVHALAAETALFTAYANDEQGDLVFAQQVWGYGRTGDALLAISTSGRSANVLYAAQAARFRGMATVALTGEDGGRLRGLCDVCIAVPGRESWRVQELHQPVYHALCLALEEEFFGENPRFRDRPRVHAATNQPGWH